MKSPILATALAMLMTMQPLLAQAPDANAPIAVMHMESRAVLVDVIVTDKSGNPVTGLKQDAFQLFEQGHPQNIASFEEHAGNQADKISTVIPELPENVFSNFSPVGRPAAVNVLLLDALNTPMDDQMLARKQALNFLESLKPGYRMAIFTLSNELRFVQGFTDDPSVLVKALKDKKNKTNEAPADLISPQYMNAQQDVISQMSQTVTTIDATGTSHTSTAAPAAMIGALQNFLQESNTSVIADREYRTLASLQQLAHFLGAFPGRKNLIWYAESFPVNVFGKTDPRFEGEVKKTIDALTVARVAIYPVDARGLKGAAWFSAENTPAGSSAGLPGQLSGAVGTSSPTQSSAGTQSSDPLNSSTNANASGNPLTAESSERNSDQATMDMMAHDSGGKAFYNTNNFTGVMDNIVRNSGNFYTLSYVPTDADMDGNYRKIDLKVSGGKYNLSFRHGYFSGTENLPGAKVSSAYTKTDDPLLPSMQLGMPQSEQILYKAYVQRVGASKETPEGGQRYSVQFAVDLKDLRLKTNEAGLHSGEVYVELFVYDRLGKLVANKNRKITLQIPAKAYEAYERTGVQLRTEIDAPKGYYWLRTGIYDPTTRKTGTMELSLARVKSPAASTASK